MRKCPICGSFNIELDDPRPDEHTCRDCGEWIDDEDLIDEDADELLARADHHRP